MKALRLIGALAGAAMASANTVVSRGKQVVSRGKQVLLAGTFRMRKLDAMEENYRRSGKRCVAQDKRAARKAKNRLRARKALR